MIFTEPNPGYKKFKFPRRICTAFVIFEVKIPRISRSNRKPPTYLIRPGTDGTSSRELTYQSDHLFVRALPWFGGLIEDEPSQPARRPGSAHRRFSFSDLSWLPFLGALLTDDRVLVLFLDESVYPWDKPALYNELSQLPKHWRFLSAHLRPTDTYSVDQSSICITYLTGERLTSKSDLQQAVRCIQVLAAQGLHALPRCIGSEVVCIQHATISKDLA
ncbi:hypothetical protein DFS33DRAFT_1366822 [Desarmillaria ectypa]|nr:hypothetical protein DFS33DRAFT_1366822 [Desarmillaria ectypa]